MRHAGNLDSPVGMCLIQSAVYVYHLRLNPDAKVYSEFIQSVTQPLKPVGELMLIHLPVAKRGGIIIPVAEPSVIHD